MLSVPKIDAKHESHTGRSVLKSESTESTLELHPSDDPLPKPAESDTSLPVSKRRLISLHDHRGLDGT